MPKGNRNATHKEPKNTIFHINRKKAKVQKLPFGLKAFVVVLPTEINTISREQENTQKKLVYYIATTEMMRAFCNENPKTCLLWCLVLELGQSSRRLRST